MQNGSYINQDNPQFVNRSNNDFHLDAFNSPAVDYCDNNPDVNLHKDMDFQDRGWDDPIINEHFNGSFYDIGAYEAYGNDIIFKNNFEEL